MSEMSNYKWLKWPCQLEGAEQLNELIRRGGEGGRQGKEVLLLYN